MKQNFFLKVKLEENRKIFLKFINFKILLKLKWFYIYLKKNLIITFFFFTFIIYQVKQLYIFFSKYIKQSIF